MLLNLSFGTVGCGCTDSSACNYDSNAVWDSWFLLVMNVLSVCSGSCTADADSDGVCDDVDDCVGVFDACGAICNGPGAIYECGCSDNSAGDWP